VPRVADGRYLCRHGTPDMRGAAATLGHAVVVFRCVEVYYTAVAAAVRTGLGNPSVAAQSWEGNLS